MTNQTEQLAARLLLLADNPQTGEPGLITWIEQNDLEQHAEGGCDADGCALRPAQVDPARAEIAELAFIRSALGLTR